MCAAHHKLSPDHKWLAVTVDVDGTEAYRVAVRNLDTGRFEPIFTEQTAKRRVGQQGRPCAAASRKVAAIEWAHAPHQPPVLLYTGTATIKAEPVAHFFRRTWN